MKLAYFIFAESGYTCWQYYAANQVSTYQVTHDNSVVFESDNFDAVQDWFDNI